MPMSVPMSVPMIVVPAIAVVVIVVVVVTRRPMLALIATLPHTTMILVLVIILALVLVPGECGAEVVRGVGDEQASAGRPVLLRVARLALIRLGRGGDEC